MELWGCRQHAIATTRFHAGLGQGYGLDRFRDHEFADWDTYWDGDVVGSLNGGKERNIQGSGFVYVGLGHDNGGRACWAPRLDLKLVFAVLDSWDHDKSTGLVTETTGPRVKRVAWSAVGWLLPMFMVDVMDCRERAILAVGNGTGKN